MKTLKEIILESISIGNEQLDENVNSADIKKIETLLKNKNTSISVKSGKVDPLSKSPIVVELYSESVSKDTTFVLEVSKIRQVYMS